MAPKFSENGTESEQCLINLIFNLDFHGESALLVVQLVQLFMHVYAKFIDQIQ